MRGFTFISHHIERHKQLTFMKHLLCRHYSELFTSIKSLLFTYYQSHFTDEETGLERLWGLHVSGKEHAALPHHSPWLFLLVSLMNSFSRSGPQTCSNSIFWLFVRNAILNPHLRPSESEILEVGTLPCFNEPCSGCWCELGLGTTALDYRASVVLFQTLIFAASVKPLLGF